MLENERFEIEMVLTYVPEAEFMSWELAVFTASYRDVEAARQLEWSALDADICTSN